MATIDKFPGYLTYVDRKMIHNIINADASHVRAVAKLYNINVRQFKKDHSKELLFALIKK
jgi:hypothetical protein